jgi:hypothetical protein
MKLTECNFYRSGKDVNFSVFSDDVCRVHYLRNISLPLGGDVDVYGVEPGEQSHWIVVRQTEDGKHELRWFVRKGRNFEERRGNLPAAVKAEVGERFPQLIPRHPAMVA